MIEESKIGKQLLVSGIPKRFEKFRLQDLKDISKENIKSLQDYINNFPKNKPESLYLYGPVGSGKTSVASALLSEIIERDKIKLVAYFVNLPRLLGEIRSSYSGDSVLEETYLLDKLFRANLIVLDEVGSEKQTEWLSDKLYLIINDRYENELPVIYVSNYEIEELRDRVGSRIVSRIIESCKILEIGTKTLREKIFG